MKRRPSVVFNMLPIAMIWAASSLPLQAETRDVLVVPVTPSAVSLALDVAKLRPVEVLTYERDAKGDAFLHTWAQTEAQWQGVALGDIATGNAFDSKVAQTIVIGPAKGIPTDLARVLSDLETARQIPTLETAVVINKLHGVFDFSGKEWKWLAGRHGLELYDRNGERRRWGKYGPPEGKSPSATSGLVVGEETSLEPVEVVEVSIEPTEIRVPDEVQRTPRLRARSDADIPLTGQPIQMEITPVAVPATDSPTPEAKTPELSTDLLDASPELEYPADTK